MFQCMEVQIFKTAIEPGRLAQHLTKVALPVLVRHLLWNVRLVSPDIAVHGVKPSMFCSLHACYQPLAENGTEEWRHALNTAHVWGNRLFPRARHNCVFPRTCSAIMQRCCHYHRERYAVDPCCLLSSPCLLWFLVLGRSLYREKLSVWSLLMTYPVPGRQGFHFRAARRKVTTWLPCFLSTFYMSWLLSIFSTT